MNTKGEYAQEARGLWEMEGDMMGGPFVSHARVDRANGRVVVVEAFILSLIHIYPVGKRRGRCITGSRHNACCLRGLPKDRDSPWC